MRFSAFTIAVMLCLISSAVPADAVPSKTYVFGCTADKKPARIKVKIELKDRKVVEAAFRRFIQDKTSQWFLAQRKMPLGSEWGSAIASIASYAGTAFGEQSPAAIASSISIGLKERSKRKYCGA